MIKTVVQLLFPIVMGLFVVISISSYYNTPINTKSSSAIIIFIFAILSVAVLLVLTIKSLIPLFRRENTVITDLFEVVSNIICLIVLFASMYALIFIFDKSSFSGIRNGGIVAVTTDFLYFSIVTFTTLGFGDIHPISTLAKICVAFEPLVSTIGISIILVFFVKNLKKQRADCPNIDEPN